MDFLGVLFAGMGLYLGSVYFIHGVLKDPASRRRALDRLHTPLFDQLYRHTLRNGLAWLAWFFGGRRPNTFLAFNVCYTLSLFYSAGFLLLSWALGGSGSIGTTELLPPKTPEPQRAITLIIVIIVGFYIFKRFRNLARTTNFTELFWKVEGENYIAGPFIATIIILISFTAVSGIGAIGIVLAISLATAGAFSKGNKFGRALAGTGIIASTQAIIVIIALIVATLVDPSTLLSDNAIITILFLLLFPLFNALLDWLSWWISRFLGRHILLTRGLWRTIPLHTLIDLIAALLLLTIMCVSFTLFIEVFNLWAATYGGEPPLALENLISTTRSFPFGSEGLWITLMLLSTLLPTTLHLGMLFMGFVAIHAPKGLRAAVARNLGGDPAHIQLIGPAMYLTAMPMIGLTLAGLAFWGAFNFLSAVGAPVTDGLAELALWTIGWVRAL